MFPWFSVAGPYYYGLTNTAARRGPATENQGNTMVHNLDLKNLNFSLFV